MPGKPGPYGTKDHIGGCDSEGFELFIESTLKRSGLTTRPLRRLPLGYSIQYSDCPYDNSCNCEDNSQRPSGIRLVAFRHPAFHTLQRGLVICLVGIHAFLQHGDFPSELVIVRGFGHGLQGYVATIGRSRTPVRSVQSVNPCKSVGYGLTGECPANRSQGLHSEATVHHGPCQQASVI